MENTVATTGIIKNKHSEEEVNRLLEIMKSNTLEGRTAKLLSEAGTADYIEEFRQMMTAYFACNDFKDLSKSGKRSSVWLITALFEYISKLDKS